MFHGFRRWIYVAPRAPRACATIEISGSGGEVLAVDQREAAWKLTGSRSRARAAVQDSPARRTRRAADERRVHALTPPW